MSYVKGIIVKEGKYQKTKELENDAGRRVVVCIQ